MKQTQKGFPLIELMLLIAIILILVALFGSAVFNMWVNNMAKTEQRATNNMELFINKNNLTINRSGCAGDSDHDGYGSCTIHTKNGDTVYLQCPASWMSVQVFGATGCKEIEGQQKLLLK